MITHDFTGTSSKSYEDSIVLGIYAASEFLTDMQDAHVVIKDLSETAPKQYTALLEVTKDPLGLAYTKDEFEEAGDKPQDSDEKFKVYRRKGFVTLKALIVDHFAKKGQAAPSGIPDFILAPLNAMDIENNAIEKAFMFAAEAMPVPIESNVIPSAPEPAQVFSGEQGNPIVSPDTKPAARPMEEPV